MQGDVVLHAATGADDHPAAKVRPQNGIKPDAGPILHHHITNEYGGGGNENVPADLGPLAVKFNQHAAVPSCLSRSFYRPMVAERVEIQKRVPGERTAYPAPSYRGGSILLNEVFLLAVGGPQLIRQSAPRRLLRQCLVAARQIAAGRR